MSALRSPSQRSKLKVLMKRSAHPSVANIRAEWFRVHRKVDINFIHLPNLVIKCSESSFLTQKVCVETPENQ